MKKGVKAKKECLLEVEDLRIRLEEAEETLRALRRGEVDGLVVSGPEGDRVFTLKGAERSYRFFVEDMNEGAVTLAFDGTILYCNDCFAKMVETPYQKIIGDSIYRFVLSPDAFEPAFHKGKTDRSKTEVLLKRKDNQLVPVFVSFNPMQEDEVAGVCLVVTDLTEHKRQDEYARSLIDSSLDPLVTISPDGKITDVNEATIKVTGIPRGELIGTDFSSYFTEPEKAREGYQQVFARGFVTDYPLTIHHKDGRLTAVLYNASVYKDTRGNVLGVFAAARDITAQKEAEEEVLRLNAELEAKVAKRTAQLEATNKALKDEIAERERAEEESKRLQHAIQEERDRLTVLVNSITDEVWFADTQKKFTLANPPALREFGLDSAGSGIGVENFTANLELYRPDGSPRPIQENPALRALQGEVIKNQEEIVRTPATGELRYRQASSAPVRNAVGDIIGSVSVVRDITDHKRAEEKLRRNEATLRGILNATQESIWLFSADGIMLMGNETALRRFGKPAEEVIGKHFTEILPPELARSRLERLKEAVEWNHLVEFEDQRAGILFHHSFYPIQDDQGRVTSVACFSRDISESKRAEIALQESQSALQRSHDELEKRVQERTAELAQAMDALGAERQRFQDVLNMLPAYVILLAPDYNVPFANRFFEERFGKSGGRRCYEYLFNRTEACETCESYRALKNNAPHRWEWTGPDGRNYDIYDFPFSDVDGSPLILEMGLDITERKRAEAAVQKERQRLYDVLETLPVMVCLLTADYHVAFANRSFRERFGEAGGRNCYEYCFGRPGPCEFCESYKVLETGKPRHWELKTPDGKSIIDAYDYPFTDVDGSRLILEMDIDITERRQAEEALRKAHEDLKEEMAKREKAEERLRQGQKMEAIGTLTGGIAHDFNNILGAIVINSEMALLDLPGKSGIRSNLDLIHKSALRGKDLVGQMLLFSRKSDKKQAVMTLIPLIKETFKLLRSSIPTTIQMELHVKTESDTIYADPSQIQQVIMNLCTNAAYAMRGTMGSIDISLEDRTFGSHDLPDADMKPGDYLVLSVKDTGSGIDDEVKKRIFEPFFTTKPVGEGTGLGLPVAYGIVKGHKGNITVYSEQGRGSIFKVYLPKVDAGVSKAAETLGPIPGGTERILLVDDEEMIINSVQNMLQYLGYKVTALMDSQDALKLFSANPSEFDLVITDQTMPSTTGEDLGKELMRIRPDIPVILCTGYSDMISSEKAMALGFQSFIMKPFTVREGAELVRRVLDQDRSK